MTHLATAFVTLLTSTIGIFMKAVNLDWKSEGNFNSLHEGQNMSLAISWREDSEIRGIRNNQHTKQFTIR